MSKFKKGETLLVWNNDENAKVEREFVINLDGLFFCKSHFNIAALRGWKNAEKLPEYKKYVPFESGSETVDVVVKAIVGKNGIVYTDCYFHNNCVNIMRKYTYQELFDDFLINDKPAGKKG